VILKNGAKNSPLKNNPSIEKGDFQRTVFAHPFLAIILKCQHLQDTVVTNWGYTIVGITLTDLSRFFPLYFNAF